MDATDINLQRAGDRLVNLHVLQCVSPLVYGLTQAELSGSQCEALGIDDEQLIDAWSRPVRVDDYRDAMSDDDERRIQFSEEPEGWLWRIIDPNDPEEEHEADGEAYTELEAYREAFDAAGLDQPDGAEIYEHWIVSDWLAAQLEQRGERVLRDFAGLTIWARPTTGQAIAIDSVIEDIAKTYFLPPERPERYAANTVHAGGVYRDGEPIAFTRGSALEAKAVAACIAAALNKAEG